MSLALTDRQSREIAAFCQIARENGAIISLRELIGLAAIDASEHELAGAFLSDSKLRSKYLLESGYVLERSPLVDQPIEQMVQEETERRRRARVNLERGNAFGRLLVRGAVLVSVSGANSYLSAKENEDIDFFCVTRTNGMWSFMLKSLLIARIYELANGRSPELCFSCIMDEKWAGKAFGSLQPAIFARDALTAKVIGGEDAYHSLLAEASWMRDYFPVFYEMRLRETTLPHEIHVRKGRNTRVTSVVLNSLLYHLLGSFLRLKSWALNRRLAKASQRSAIFETRIGLGHYIYESNRYRNLSIIYQELVEDSSGTPAGPRGESRNEMETAEVITQGRMSGNPHVAVVRFVHAKGAYYVMGAGMKSDWYRNALRSGSAKISLGGSMQVVACEECADQALVRRLFTEKYGAATVEQWYSAQEIRSLKLTPIQRARL